MFEESLVESQHLTASPHQRWTTALSITLQCALVAVVLAVPLLHPERLPFSTAAPRLLPPIHHAPPPTPAQAKPAQASSAALLPANASPALLAPHSTPTRINLAPDPGPAPIANFSGSFADSFPSNLATSAAGSSSRPVTIAPVPATHPLHVSTGIAQGLLLAPIQPVYPQIARATHTEGVVIIEAIISKSGRIESAHAVSGPPLLRQAAVAAVAAARYSPYALNGQPTEVETTITITFRMGN